MSAIRVVVVKSGQIYLLPLASEIKKQERLQRLRYKLENGLPLDTASVSHGGGILSHALHAGIQAQLRFVNEIRHDLVEHASENLVCVVSCISMPLIATAQVNSTDSKPTAKAPMNSNSMAENKGMAIKKSMERMQQNMSSISMSEDTDHEFALMMKEHHQGAIDMAEIELKQGQYSQLKKMASKIIAAQKKEIAEFDTWLKKHEVSMSSTQVNDRFKSIYLLPILMGSNTQKNLRYNPTHEKAAPTLSAVHHVCGDTISRVRCCGYGGLQHGASPCIPRRTA